MPGSWSLIALFQRNTAVISYLKTEFLSRMK